MKDSLKIRLDEFFVDSPKPERSHTLLSVTVPERTEELSTKGTLFVLFEVEQGNAKVIEYFQNFASFLEQFYYDEYVGERNHFEDTIVHANQLLRGFEIPGNTGVHAIVGLLRNDTISFSTHGKPGIWLFARGTRRAHSLAQEATDTDAFFSELVEGVLSIQDIILLSSTHLEDYFTPDRLAKIVHGHNSREVSRHLQRTLTDLGSGLSFSGVVAEAVPGGSKKISSKVKAGSHDSIQNLLAGQDKTKELLTPTAFKNTWMWLSEQWDLRPGAPKKSKSEKKPKSSEEGFLLGHFLWHIAQNGGMLILRLIRGVVVGIYQLWRLAISLIKSSPEQRRSAKTLLNHKARGRFSFFTMQFKQLPAKRRYTLLSIAGAAVLVLGIAGTLFFTSIQKKNITKFNQTTRDVLRLSEESAAAQIYGADDVSKNKLKEAQTLLDSLDPKNRQQNAEHEQLVGMIYQALVELRREVRPLAEVVVEINNETLAPPRWLGQIDRTLLAGSSHTSKSVSVDLTSGAIQENGSPLPLTNPLSFEDTLYFQLGNSLHSIDPNGELTERFANLDNAVDYALFNDKLYVLRPNENQIMSHNPRNDGFSPLRRNWITENNIIFPLNASFLAIDGSLYVFNDSGSVQKFNRGSSVSFTLSPTEPQLESVSGVWTTEDTDFIYILDPSVGRLLTYDKDGKLVAQYVNEKLSSATDFVINEDDKSALFINSAEIIKLPLSHL